jgi:hypothetical protein
MYEKDLILGNIIPLDNHRWPTSLLKVTEDRSFAYKLVSISNYAHYPDRTWSPNHIHVSLDEFNHNFLSPDAKILGEAIAQPDTGSPILCFCRTHPFPFHKIPLYVYKGYANELFYAAAIRLDRRM